jgi:hypothetical protein
MYRRSVFILGCILFLGYQAIAQPLPLEGHYSVKHFGAVGDGETDDTSAFQRAMDTAFEQGGGVVHVPRGQYRFEGNLAIPENVTLEGLWRAPVRGMPVDRGSVLLPTANKGNPDAPPFISMGTSSVLKGLTIFYPEQVIANPPHAYPWTVQASRNTDNVTILDVTMVNPYQAVDLGTYVTGRHLVQRLYGYPLFKGLYVNQCYDVGRLEDIHFWPFWEIDPDSPLWDFTKENATAFIIGKTDGEMGHNLFSIFYSVGMHFIDGPIYNTDREVVSHAAGSGMYTNCYMDVTPCAIKVDSVMETAGVTFTNASIMSKVVVGPRNRGPVKFNGSGFWATGDLDSHAVLEGRGAVIFQGCQFNDWDRAAMGAPCINANNRRLIVNACDFPTHRDDHQLVRLGPRLRAAVITSNTMPGGEHIINVAPDRADVQIALNAVEPPENFLDEWIVLGPFPNPEIESPTAAKTREGLDQDFLEALGGEAKATLSRDTELDYSNSTLKARQLRAGGNHKVDLHRLSLDPQQVAYAFSWILSDRDQEANLEFGMNDGGKVFLNGEEVYRRYSPNGQAARPGYDYCRVKLKKGRNRLLLKIEDGGGKRWEFLLEAYGEDGTPLESTIITP